MKEKAAPSLAGNERLQVKSTQKNNTISDYHFARLAPKLIDNGYPTIPVWPGKKEAACNNWTQFAYKQPSAGHLTRWANSRADHSIGIVGGRIVGLDIDVMDHEAAGRLLDLARGHCGATPLVRIGRFPKRLLVYRASGIIPSRSINLNCGNIDLISEGRQFVAYGIHPDTQRPYSWDEGSGHPFDTPADRLPELELWQIDELFAAAARYFPAPVAVRKAHRDESGIIVRHPGTGRIVNGRETYLRGVILKACGNRGRRTVSELVADIFDEFCQTAETGRPHSGTGKPFSIEFVRKKVVYTLKRIDEKKVKRIAQGRVAIPPKAGREIDAGGREAFRRFVDALVIQGKLPPSAGQVSAFMLDELVGGFCVHSVQRIAEATGLAITTAKAARNRLVTDGLWDRARQLRRLHTAPYWPTTLKLDQAIEEYGKSSGSRRVSIHIPQSTTPLCSIEECNDNAEPSNLAPVMMLDHMVQGDLLPFLDAERPSGWEPPASVKDYRGGIIPSEIRQAILEKKRALAMRQEEVAWRIGLSRPQLANALQGRFGLSEEAASRLVTWLLSSLKPTRRCRAA